MISHRKNCRGCFSKKITKFLDLGSMPLAGGFLKKNEIKKEKKFPLRVYYCEECGLVQILDIIDPAILFKNYFYLSSVIKSLSEHFRNYAKFLKSDYLKDPSAKLLEFGCNDGVLLQYLKDRDAFGVDPSHNVSKIAKAKKLRVWTNYFNQKSAKKIMDEIGKVDVVTGSNVFAHVDDIHEIIKAAKIILNPKGVFIIEVHYLKDLLDKFQYDTIYHEHLCYYSVSALKDIFAKVNMKIIDVVHLDMHGGGIRVVAVDKLSRRREKKSVSEFLKREKNVNLARLKMFGKYCHQHKERLTSLLNEIKRKKNKIVGYGAPGRGTILLNYCKIGKKFLDYIVDVSPLRSGMLMPGVHIPIVFPQVARKNPPDYFLVLAWNYARSILEQEKKLRKKGVKLIIPFPKIRII